VSTLTISLIASLIPPASSLISIDAIDDYETWDVFATNHHKDMVDEGLKIPPVKDPTTFEKMQKSLTDQLKLKFTTPKERDIYKCGSETVFDYSKIPKCPRTLFTRTINKNHTNNTTRTSIS
jgi:hypothetical protein